MALYIIENTTGLLRMKFWRGATPLHDCLVIFAPLADVLKRGYWPCSLRIGARSGVVSISIRVSLGKTTSRPRWMKLS